MKIIKTTTGMDIVTSIDGNLYHITPTGIQVTAEIAEKMKGQFLQTVEVVDIGVETGVETGKPSDTVETDSDSTESPEVV